MTSGGNNYKLCPPNFLIFVPTEDFCDAFCVARGAFGRPCHGLGPEKSLRCKLAVMVEVKWKKSDPGRKQCTIKYHLKRGEERLQVCKSMFLSTVQDGIKKAEDGIVPASNHHSMPQMNRSTHQLRQNIREFLNDLPKLPLHYCRSSTTKLFSEPHIRSLTDVYKVYKEKQAGEVASRQVFTDEFKTRPSMTE